jgi:UDP-3-O-[3-hydroxymyristoyl] N-acetylglucosamine deacetylase
MKKILIIDDEKNIQVSLASILEDEGYKIFFAKDGEEGIEKFKNVRPEAVFLDIWLPGIDGIEVMKTILTADPSVIIIMMSGHSSIAAAVSAVKAGAYDFLEKPLSLEKVIFVLKRGLEYRQILVENQKLKTILNEEMAFENEDHAIARQPENTAALEFPVGEYQSYKPQKTIRNSNIFYGIGLHSGEKTGLVIKPLPPNKGIRFQNISTEGYIPARIAYINTTGYSTSIKKDNLEARTIEHLMAVLNAYGITNLAIKINREVPIDDGSALNLCEFIRESGIVEQNALIPEIVIDEPIELASDSDAEKFMRIEPCDYFTVRYTCIYPEPLGRQTYEFAMTSSEAFAQEIAPARTYGFVEESRRLMEMGLAEGARMNNFILIDDGKILNTQLRFPDELSRHKILDIIGDFFLLGCPLRGRIIAQKTGHRENARMVNLLREKYLTG